MEGNTLETSKSLNSNGNSLIEMYLINWHMRQHPLLTGCGLSIYYHICLLSVQNTRLVSFFSQHCCERDLHLVYSLMHVILIYIVNTLNYLKINFTVDSIYCPTCQSKGEPHMVSLLVLRDAAKSLASMSNALMVISSLDTAVADSLVLFRNTAARSC